MEISDHTLGWGGGWIKGSADRQGWSCIHVSHSASLLTLSLTPHERVASAFRGKGSKSSSKAGVLPRNVDLRSLGATREILNILRFWSPFRRGSHHPKNQFHLCSYLSACRVFQIFSCSSSLQPVAPSSTPNEAGQVRPPTVSSAPGALQPSLGCWIADWI